MGLHDGVAAPPEAAHPHVPLAAGLEEEHVAYYKNYEATKPMRDAELARLGDD
jgi:hypothetical protein